LANGTVFDSLAVLAIDERRDLAVVKMDLPPLPKGYSFADGFPVLTLGNADTLSIGEPVIVVGSPRGLEGTVTAGILSSVRDSGEDFRVLQTDAAVNPGNSGGPLVNNKGQAVGVVSFKLRSSEGLNFAIPINYVRGLLNNLHEPISLEQMQKNVGKATEPAQGRSLEETIDLLRHFVSLSGVQFVSYNPNFSAYESTSIRDTLSAADSCNVGMKRTIQSTLDTPYSSKLLAEFSYTVPLGLLIKVDVENVPNSEHVVSGDESCYRVTLRTSKAMTLVHWETNQYLSTPRIETSTVDSMSVTLSDRTVAPGFVMRFYALRTSAARSRPPFDVPCGLTGTARTPPRNAFVGESATYHVNCLDSSTTPSCLNLFHD
jgi:hypothetical protein